MAEFPYPPRQRAKELLEACTFVLSAPFASTSFPTEFPYQPMDTQVRIQTVETGSDWETFLDLPQQVYQGDPHWVPPLRRSVAANFDRSNPFYQYGELQAFLAWREDRNHHHPTAVGRIVAAINHRLIEREGEAVGVFGFFECIEDFQAARLLLASACDWLRSHGMTRVRGPIDLSTHNNCLFLVDGFDDPPLVMMPYNPPYYPQFVEKAGFAKAKDAYAYNLPLDKPLPPKFAKAYRIACQSGITFRPVRHRGEGFTEDVRHIYHLFNATFSGSWSSTPRTEAEFFETAKDLKSTVDRDVFSFAEENGKPVGFFMSLPDYNIPLRHVNGKLNWWGMLKFLWYRRQIDRLRVLVICVLPEYRRKMVAMALIYHNHHHGSQPSKPYKNAELSWVWEDNTNSRRVIEATGCTIYKTYRMYEKAL